MTKVNGNALAIVPACNASSPPAISSAIAIAPTISAQKMRCHTGDCSSPLDESMSITSAPESADVTKKITTSRVATAEVSSGNGYASRNWNSATEVSALTAATRPGDCPDMIWYSALLP